MSIRIEDLAKVDFRSVTVAGGKPYDMRLARTTIAKKLARIKPWSAHSEAKAS
jgi:hypothetical protein